jgi:uncharacterized protein (DUF1501 family)
VITRRSFLTVSAGVSALSLSGRLPGLFAQAAEQATRADANDHILVVVEQNGGNDGLNTLIPFEDSLYYKNRPTLGIPADQVVRLSDQVALHPQMAALGELFKGGKAAVVQGAGYPDPDRSHFRSMEIWHTASVAKTPPPTGWLGRFLDSAEGAGDPAVIRGLSLSGGLPQAFQAGKAVVPVVSQLDALANANQDEQSKVFRRLSTSPENQGGALDFLRKQADATFRAADQLRQASAQYKSTVTYPASDLGSQLQRAAQILSADLGVRVVFVSQGGYDTHSDQAYAHGQLLLDLSDSLAAFQKDLAGLGFAERTATLVFSEFGRRVDENASQGTDHGAGSCLFVVGEKVKGGLFGTYPSLETLGDGDLIFTTDFRSVYADLLGKWLGSPPDRVLEGKFEPVGIV